MPMSWRKYAQANVKLVGIELDSSLRLMFRGNMIVPSHKLTIILKVVVNRLVRLEELVIHA